MPRSAASYHRLSLAGRACLPLVCSLSSLAYTTDRMRISPSCRFMNVTTCVKEANCGMPAPRAVNGAGSGGPNAKTRTGGTLLCRPVALHDVEGNPRGGTFKLLSLDSNRSGDTAGDCAAWRERSSYQDIGKRITEDECEPAGHGQEHC
jgi:hypothetical protein